MTEETTVQDVTNVQDVTTTVNSFLSGKISKKMTMTILTAIIVIANKLLDLKLPDSMVNDIVGLVMVYLAGQSAVDVTKAIKG